MSRRLPKSQEEKAAEKMTNIVKDSTLDLDQVGRYIGTMAPSYLLNKIVLVAEAGQEERERLYGRNNFTKQM